MGRNTFDVKEAYKAMDKEFTRKAQAPKIEGDYSIDETGLGGWMSYRYQYKVGPQDFFGYAETIEEAREIIIKAQEGAK